VSRALDAATDALAARDATFATLVARYGPCRFPPQPAASERFTTLALAITSQQLANAAAASIWARLQAAVGTPFTAAALVETSDDTLRGAGLSRAKTAALRDLAERVDDGRLDLRRATRLDDEALIGTLSAVRGIGRWTAEMFCIFALRRLDIWPTLDLGVRQGYTAAFGLPAVPSAIELLPAGDPFRPYRSVLAWYCWQAAASARQRRPGASRPRAAGPEKQRDPE
jgi:DNA-3-methyladenine glycosylase II